MSGIHGQRRFRVQINANNLQVQFAKKTFSVILVR
jgi:hypothetical protein